jgi:catechol 2,3-dioxygenase
MTIKSDIGGARLPQSIRMGMVTLNVANLSRMKEFYGDIIGLEILEETESAVTLGRNGVQIVRVVERKELHIAEPGSAGLFHTAIVFETRQELARTLVSIFQNAPDQFGGSGDHLVSQAFYFHDPEGNGLELYFDRPRDQWIWENGQIKMATLYIDPVKFIQENISERPGSTQVRIGHVHLKVGDIALVREFYVDILGFDVTAQIPDGTPSALFISAGGYHHHLGLNTWESAGASKRLPSLGLGSFTITFDSIGEIDAIANRLKSKGIQIHTSDTGSIFEDPWGNSIVLMLSR